MSDKINLFGCEAASQEPNETLKWEMGDTITRDNAASFLWQSFFLSQGSDAYQALIFLILIENGYLESFSVPVTLAINLTSAEIDVILHEYNRIGVHPVRNPKDIRESMLKILNKIKETADKECCNPRKMARLDFNQSKLAGLQVLANARNNNIHALTNAVTK